MSTALSDPSPWTVQLLGGPQAVRADRTVNHFGSRSAAALLARLALNPQRLHAREELIELLWPGVALEVGRNRLRQTLFILRRLLEPDGTAAVLSADRTGLRVLDGAIVSDAVQFERAVREGRHAEALSLYRGELLPGFYDDWIANERLRLAALHDRIDRSALALLPIAQLRSLPPLPVPPAAVAPSPAEAPAPLPAYLTRFFGRDDEARRLREMVAQHRLVTLLGPGGSGKTRLSVELAATLRAEAAFDRIVFVPLVACSTREQALAALHDALRITRQPSPDDVLAGLRATLSGQRVLLVLDNFEQLSGLAEDLLATLSARLPALHLLVSSRRVLGIDGEREFVVQPLALPSAGLAPGEAASNPSVALFADRAQAVRAEFGIDARNLASVVDLILLLEGMPLAIELAAARVRSLAPADMAALLRQARDDLQSDDALALLARSGPRAGGDPRHASMQQVIDWSWRLLPPDHARLLTALTVFRGSFTGAAAREACAVTLGASAGAVAVGLDELVTHSLLRVIDDATTGSGPSRFALFEPIREFAAARLDADTARALRAAHRAWLTRWGRELPATPPLDAFRAEQPNLQAALASALGDDRPDEAVRLIAPLRRVLEDVELPADGLALFEAAVERCVDAALKAHGQLLLGPLLFVAGRGSDALRQVLAALAAIPPGSPLRGRALHAAARVTWRARRDAATAGPWLDEAAHIATAQSDDDLLASVTALRAFIANAHRDPAAGERLHAQALALWEGQGNRHAIDSGRYNLCVCALNDGRHLEALARLDAVTDSARELHDIRRLRQALNVRGLALCGLRQWAEGAQALRDAVRLAWDGMALHDLGHALWNLPRALAHERRPETALTLAGFAAHFWVLHFGPLAAADQRDLLRVRRLARRQLDAATCAALYASGARMTVAEAVALALRVE